MTPEGRDIAARSPRALLVTESNAAGPDVAADLQLLTQKEARYIMGLHATLIVPDGFGRTKMKTEKRGTWAMGDFGHLLASEIPRLRRYARALTRDGARADDLVQSCLARALAKSHLWEPGTDLRAWLFTILHNQHVNDVRRAVREGINIPVEDVTPMLATQSTQTSALSLRDLDRSLGRLPEEQRQVLLLVGLEGMRYEEVATILNVPVGTVRSRLSRGRDMLRYLMDMKPLRERVPDEEIAERAPRIRRRPSPITERSAA
jgi:RNA polymerase sigma-70 factor, ECF subfamily